MAGYELDPEPVDPEPIPIGADVFGAAEFC